MLAVLAAVVLSAEPVSLAIPGLNPVNITSAEAEYYAETLAGDLILLKLRVMTARDIATVVGLERQRELLGCSESSCYTELAGALGTNGVVVGDVGKIGAEYALDLKVIRPDGTVLALYNTRVQKAEQVPPALTAAAREVAHQLAKALSRPELEPAPLPAPLEKRRRSWALVPAALGVVALGTGGGLQLGASQQYDLLMNAGYPKQARDAKSLGQGLELSGNITLAVGAVAMVAAIVWFFYAGGFE